ncbi:hypothetical protein ACOKFD_13840 [Flagellimonas sp. S174]|uniref:hypothetical protein n=1 Tax=Flagellimonas sp. S174 TaxID=3410790 RepID=UPI003BF47D9D
MTICLLRLSVDFGLLVLIWIVQLIIYPSFSFFSKENLIEWHKKYTRAMGYIVAPLMLSQLGIYLKIVYDEPSMSTVLPLVLVLGTWLITFFQFVPRHQAISEGQVSDTLLKELVTKNWIRTTLWSLLFVVSCIYCLRV